MKDYTWIGLALAVSFAGCASTSGSASPPATTAATTTAGSGMGMMADSCPMQVAGTTVAASDVASGASLAFTTTGDVAAVRLRVRRMADMHNQRQASGGMMHGAGMMNGAGMMMPAAAASVEDIEGGARLVFQPTDPSQLEALRAQVRMHASRMTGGACPMMSRGTQASATSPNGPASIQSPPGT